jgi:hypothetical protein
MSRESENKITEWVLWFQEHRGAVERNPDPENAKRFLMKAVDGAFECIAMALTDIQELENRKSLTGSPAHQGILLPRHTRFG